MKPTMSLALSFLFFAFITTNLPSAFSEDAEKLFTTKGNPLFPGGSYYIVPAIHGPAGGGVWPGTIGDTMCPVTVLQAYGEVITGKPVKFIIAGKVGNGVISTGTPLDIAFQRQPYCAESSKWVVIDANDGQLFPRSWVGIGGANDHPGKQILDGTFNIQKYGFGYKIVFCPTATAPPGVCYDIGRHDDPMGRRLVTLPDGHGYEPFEVVFVDADASGIRSVV